ncbi:hypothetical protein [Paraeggerthella hongkongensis]|uniref:Uncharacterized protein n=1 Tax=Paraeggerthella hongkongensis TaxID=230658 RepID=A0A3N0BK42_9ACTN|nr:hypothetical protein [Paraeggerthella hongkongensis]RNL48375.1 hypothetical protein DMP08_01815 [Paraeggerthella hongkongensis]
MPFAKPRFSVIGVCALAVFAAALSGCTSGQHQVIDANEACVSCHPDGKAVRFWGADVPADVIESGTAVTVRTDAVSVLVCEPAFTSEDGSSFVPVLDSAVSTRGEETIVRLADGLWALCTDHDGSVRAQLVHVSSSSPHAAVVEL